MTIGPAITLPGQLYAGDDVAIGVRAAMAPHIVGFEIVESKDYTGKRHAVYRFESGCHRRFSQFVMLHKTLRSRAREAGKRAPPPLPGKRSLRSSLEHSFLRSRAYALQIWILQVMGSADWAELPEVKAFVGEAAGSSSGSTIRSTEEVEAEAAADEVAEAPTSPSHPLLGAAAEAAGEVESNAASPSSSAAETAAVTEAVAEQAVVQPATGAEMPTAGSPARRAVGAEEDEAAEAKASAATAETGETAAESPRQAATGSKAVAAPKQQLPPWLVAIVTCNMSACFAE